MQQCALSFAVGKDSNASLKRFDGICVHDSFPYAGDEEGGLASLEFVVEVDEEREETGLAGIHWGGVVLVGICGWIDARGWPSAVCQMNVSISVARRMYRESSPI